MFFFFLGIESFVKIFPQNSFFLNLNMPFWLVQVPYLLNKGSFYWSEEPFSKNNFDLRIHWRLSTILKTNSKSVWSNVFWYVKVCIFWKHIQYTIHWDKTQMLKKIPLDKINSTKNTLFFLLQAPIHHSFTFNLWFLYELKHKVCLSKTVCGVFHFWFCFVFIKVYIFVQ